MSERGKIGWVIAGGVCVTLVGFSFLEISEQGFSSVDSSSRRSDLRTPFAFSLVFYFPPFFNCI